MTQLPPFRTRRSEPVLHRDETNEALESSGAPLTPLEPAPDDDVPVLTQVVESPPPIAPEPSPTASMPAAEVASSAPPPDAAEVEVLTAAIVAALTPRLHEMVRAAIHEAFDRESSD